MLQNWNVVVVINIIFLWLMTWKGNAWKNWSDVSSGASLVGRVRSSGLAFSVKAWWYYFFGVISSTNAWLIPHVFKTCFLAFLWLYIFSFPCLRFSHVLVWFCFWDGRLELLSFVWMMILTTTTTTTTSKKKKKKLCLDEDKKNISHVNECP